MQPDFLLHGKKKLLLGAAVTHGYGEPGASQAAPVVKNPPASAGDIRDAGSIPGLGRSPEEGNSNIFQDCCLGNPMEEEPGGLQSTGSQKSWTQLSN